MSAVILEQLPLVVAGVAIICGALSGKLLLHRFTFPLSITYAGYVVALICVIAGGKVVEFLVQALISAGMSHTGAAYVAVGLISFVGGLAMGCILYKPKTATNKDGK